MIDMIGVGPFITIPLIISAAGGPQAMLGWICGALFALCDGMVWAELGAAMPEAGGSYRYLKEIYGPRRWGRLLSFLVHLAAFLQRAALHRLGLHRTGQYASYLWPALNSTLLEHTLHLDMPLLGPLEVRMLVKTRRLVAMGACVLVVILLYRRITAVGRLAELLWVG